VDAEKGIGMAENGNRGPNDVRSRGGRKRREPPIIDASATEVPAAAGDSRQDDAPDPASSEPEPFAGSAAEGTSAAEPVLFGSAFRDTPPRHPTASRTLQDPVEPETTAPWPSDRPADTRATLAPEVGAREVSPEGPVGDGNMHDAVTPESHGGPVPPSTDEDIPPTVSEKPVTAASPATRSGAGRLTGVLGAACLLLLGGIGWLLYSEPQRSGRDQTAASVADLKAKVAALEARPDPARSQGQLQADVAALDKRVAAADTERSGLAETVAGLTTRLEAVAQQAEAAKADADGVSAAAKAAAPANAPPAADTAPPTTSAFATLAGVVALAAKVDDLDTRLGALVGDQGRTAKVVADLPKPIAPDFGPVDAQVAALDGRITAVDNKLNGSDARLNGFDAKVNGVDGKINGFDARMNGLDVRMNGVEAKVDDEAAQTTRLQSAVTNLPKVDLAPLQTATAALDGRVGAVESQLAAPKDGGRLTEARAVGSADETKATPIALVGQAVQSAILDGRPYGKELDALKALGAEPETIAKLSPMATQGAPTPATLKDGWDAVQGDVLAAVKPPEAGGALDRLAASARALVRVRRVGAVQGDDPAAIVSQVDAALAAGDVATALAAWDRLPDTGKDPSRDWASSAREEVDAAAAAQSLVGRAIATLGRVKS